MERKYSFLKDPRAINEIRKHKWLQSQKEGREIGFASAAVDWIKNYGEEWKRLHVKEDKGYDIFFEQRRFRRFDLDCCVELMKNNISSFAQAVNISFFGVLCHSTDYLHIGSQLELRLACDRQAGKELNCSAVVERAYPLDSRRYELFLRFDERGQQAIESCLR